MHIPMVLTFTCISTIFALRKKKLEIKLEQFSLSVTCDRKTEGFGSSVG